MHHLSQIHPAEPVCKYLLTYWGTPPALGLLCEPREHPESLPSCCCKLPTVFRDLCTLDRLASAPPPSEWLLWISANTVHLSFTSLLSQVYPSWSCSLTFLYLFCLNCPFFSAPCSPSSLLSIVCARSHCKTNTFCDCTAHTAHFLHYFLLRYLYCLPSL